VHSPIPIRSKSWLGSDLLEMLRERSVALALIGYARVPRIAEAAAGFVHIGWLGDRQDFSSGDPHAKLDRTEDPAWWSAVDRLLSEEREVLADANNHYRNHSPSTPEQFVDTMRTSR